MNGIIIMQKRKKLPKKSINETKSKEEKHAKK